MALQFSTTLRNDMLDKITADVAGSGLLRIYTGSAPATVATAVSGTLLAELTCNATFAPGASSGALTLNAITAANASASGTAGYFRLLTSGATAHVQGTVTISGGGGDLTFDNNVFVSGQSVTISSWVITAPGA